MARRSDRGSGPAGRRPAPDRAPVAAPAAAPARPKPGARDHALAAQARLAAIVIAVAMVAWMGAQWLGGQFGWQARFVFLFDLAALAAFAWAMAVTWRVWRGGREQ